MSNKILLSDHFTISRLLRFSVPTIITMVFNSLYTVVDGLFVSNLVGDTGFAALNLIWPAIGMLGGIGFMIGAGGAALVSKTLGEQDHKRANEYFTLLVAFEIVLGLVLGGLGALLLEPIALLMGATPELLPECLEYGRVLMICQVFYMMATSFQNFIIVGEKPKLGLYIMLVAGLSNMILDWLFISVIPLGIFGAGLATGLNWVLSSCLCLYYFCSGKNNLLQLNFKKVIWRWRAIGQACANGSSEMFTHISLSLIAMLYNFELLELVGSDGVIAYGIIQYATLIFLSIFIGFTMASSPLVSYQYGAGNKVELHSLLMKSLGIVAVFALSMFLIAETLADSLALIFVSHSDVLVNMTVRAIEIYSISYLLTGFNIYVSGFFTALNNGPVSAALSFFRVLLCQIVAILVLPKFFGLDGIWSAVIVSEGVSLFLSLFFLFKLKKRYGY